jgi:tRNA A37 methylthiotransferase MiaB
LLEGNDSLTPEAIAKLPSIKTVTGKIIEAWPVDIAAIDPGYRLYTQEDLSRKLTYIESSRGCPFGCAFCLSALDPGVREFPLDRFLKEMEQLIERGGRSFKFLDRTFNLNIPRAQSIMGFFLQQVTRKTSMYVHFEMVPSRFPAELRELLTRFPPDSLRLELGIQTFNPDTAARINRPSDPAAELECLAFLRDKTNAIVHADLIAGLPGEDRASFAEGFDRLWNAGPTEIQPGILKRLPGTPLAQEKTAGVRYASDPPYNVLETAALTAGELERIGNFARFWELIVNRGAFLDVGPALFTKGAAVFDRFMALSDRLLNHFGRNWGIDRQELRQALEARAVGR